MKWTNPGHQLDDLGEKFLKVEKLYLYGINEVSKQTYDFLCWLGVADELDVSFLAGADCPKTYCGRPVIVMKPSWLRKISRAPEKVAVALLYTGEKVERKIFEEAGITNIFYLVPSNNRRDNFIQNFVCVWLMYKHGKLLSHWTNYLVTMRCNLNCKCCLNYNEFLHLPKDVTFEAFKSHIDTLFSKFDYLYSMHLCGGEPTMAKDLPKMIRYIAENYGNRIFDFFIITNGTIVPNDEIIEAMKEIGGHFLIDDYSQTTSRTKIEDVTSALDTHNVQYTLGKVSFWYDLNQDLTDYSDWSDEELERHKDSCNTYIHEFGEGRIYACCYQQYAHRAGQAALEPDDYIDIASTPKMQILEFRQGYTKKGHVSMCKTCQGIGDGAKKVAPSLQVQKRIRLNEKDKLQPGDMTDNLVSICVPIYNTEKFLERCIRSLQSQTYSSLEIILVDDGSTDESGAICDKYAAADARIKVIHKANGGESSARNAGLRAAQGEFIMFSDSDDEYFPNAVQALIDGIKADGVDLAIGGYVDKHKDAEYFATAHFRSLVSSEAVRTELMENCAYGAGYILSTVNGKLFRHELIANNRLAFDERFVIGNDSIFMNEYLSCTRTVYNVYAPTYIYYKYQPSERVQGMTWHYPDMFFLFVCVTDKRIKLAKLEIEEFNRLVAQAYQGWIYGAIDAAANEKYFENGLMPYLAASCQIDLLWIAANLDLTNHDVTQDPLLPTKQISYLVKNKRCQELRELFQAIAQSREVAPYQGEYVRQVVKLESKADWLPDSPAAETDTSVLPRKFRYAPDLGWVGRVNSLVMTVVAEGASEDVYEERLAALKEQWKPEPPIEQLRVALQASAIENERLRAAIQVYENSTIWRMTKPLRVVLDYVKGIR